VSGPRRVRMVAASTLVPLRDNTESVKPSAVPGSSARGVARTRARTWASDDVLPALSGRATELEDLARSLQADLDRARERLAAYSEFDQPLEKARVDSYLGAQEIQQAARIEADSTLERALDERRLLLKERDRLQSERDHLTDEIALARRRRLMPMRASPETDRVPVSDHRQDLAAEMRLILGALLRETLGPRPTPPQPRTAIRPRPTLLRSPLPGARQRRAPLPPREVAPAPKPPAIVAPIDATVVAPIVEDLPAPDPVRADERSETIAPFAGTETDVIESVAAVIETPSGLSDASPVTELVAPALDQAETLVITPSEDVVAATEADDPVTSDQIVEPIAMIEDPRAIALRLVETASAATGDIVPEAEADLPLDLPPLEPVISLSELSAPAPELSVAEPIHVDAPIEAQEIVEEVMRPATTPVAEPEVLRPIEAGAITDLWDSALGATQSAHEVLESPSEPLAAQVDTAMETTTIQEKSVTRESPQIAEDALSNVAPTAAPTAPAQPAVTPRHAVRELQLVLSPVTSFPQLLALQHRISSLSSVHALQLRDFRNGVATFAAGVTEALSGRELGSVLQMVVDLRLRLEGATENSVELRVDPPVS
jgi:hypothetical protein